MLKPSMLTFTPLLKNPLHSRIHSLRTFPGCFVKREDELGFAVSGTKLRKYLSLLPSLLEQKPDEVIVTGSAYSNHVVSLCQLLRENGVEPILFLLGDPTCKLQGNFLLSSLVAKSENIHWFSRSSWEKIDAMAEEFADGRTQAGIKTVVVPKGGNCASALSGAMTLAQDILRNEEESGIEFDHVFIDAGTGMAAAALVLAFSQMQKQSFVHIVQVAGNQEEFIDTLSARKKDLENFLKHPVPSPTQFKCYSPSNAPKFGSVNTEVLQTIAELARNEGFFTDPIYTAKLFYEGRKIIAKENLEGNVLFIHSGGALTLMGYQEQLQDTLTLKS